MKQILTGFLFIFFEVNIDLGGAFIGLAPDFIGFYLIGKGLCELEEKSTHFRKIRSLNSGMVVYSGIIYAINAVGVSVMLGPLNMVLRIVCTGAMLYISYNIVLGLQQIESVNRCDLACKSLMGKWKLMAISQGLVYPMLFVPALYTIVVMASLAFSTFFLVSLHTTKSLYMSKSFS